MTTHELLVKTKKASSSLLLADEKAKNNALKYMAEALLEDRDEILLENQKDLDAAKGSIGEVMLDRLMLNEARIKGMANGILEVMELPDPVGVVLEEVTRPGNLKIKKISAPMGVIAIIYESRPNVTSDAAALAIKSGSAAVLRSGKEAHRSAKAIVSALKKGIKRAGLDENLIGLVEDTTRQSANELMAAKGLIDLLIPRGGKGLITACVENAIVPCIETGTGICHIYIDSEADFGKAINIVVNAKTSRPSVCNACEVLVVNQSILESFLPKLENALYFERKASGEIPVEILADEQSIKYLKTAKPAHEGDFDTEFLDYKIAIKAVASIEEAIAHISDHSTGHSDAIITENETASEQFIKLIDSAAVYVNASTRFTDGGEFGLGCEMGISTQKLHARGPMGLRELTTYKYIVRGNGNIR